MYNACYNSVCAVVQMDTSRMRMAQFPIDEVVRPLMMEIIAIAKAKGIELPEGIAETMINADPDATFFKPSMQQDIEKVCLLISSHPNSTPHLLKVESRRGRQDG